MNSIILRKLRYDEKINKIRLEKLYQNSDVKESIEDTNPLTTISKFIKILKVIRKSIPIWRKY